MARIPQLKRLLAEDFNDQAKWIGPLLSTINDFFEKTVGVLNRRLTINENFAGSIQVVELDGEFPKKLSWSGAPPMSVLVGQVVRSDGTAITLTDAVQVQWSFNSAAQLQIDAVVGITPSASTKYKVTLESKSG